MKKISFDFDSTLSRDDVQKFAKELINLGFDVWVVTSRFSSNEAERLNWWWISQNNQELYNTTQRLGIPDDNVVFTNMSDKIDYLKNKDFLFHLDDDMIEIDLINESGDSCKGIWVELENWKELCGNLFYIIGFPDIFN